MKVKLNKLAEALGEPLDGRILELDTKARYLLMLKSSPLGLDIDRVMDAIKKVFPEGHVMVAEEGTFTVYELRPE